MRLANAAINSCRLLVEAGQACDVIFAYAYAEVANKDVRRPGGTFKDSCCDTWLGSQTFEHPAQTLPKGQTYGTDRALPKPSYRLLPTRIRLSSGECRLKC